MATSPARRIIAAIVVRIAASKYPEIDGDTGIKINAVVVPMYLPQKYGLYIQVYPTGETVYDTGQGHQEGGALYRALQFTLRFWFRFKHDEYGDTENILMKPDIGVLDFCEFVRTLIEQTTLNTVQQPYLVEPIKYLNGPTTMQEDGAKGVYYSEMTFLATYCLVLNGELPVT